MRLITLLLLVAHLVLAQAVAFAEDGDRVGNAKRNRGGSGVGNVRGGSGVGNVRGSKKKDSGNNRKGGSGVGNGKTMEGEDPNPYNGAGGREKKSGWIPFGLGVLFSRGWTRSYNYEELVEKHQILLRVCRGKPDLPFMVLPAPLAQSIELQDKTGRLLDYDLICKDRKLFLLHEELIASLVQLSGDPVFQYLLGEIKTMTKQPLRIRLTDKVFRLKVKGGTVDETSWFDQREKVIYLAPGTDRGGFAAIFGRGLSSLVLHEMAHVFTHSLYGGYQKVDYWHDLSKPLRVIKGGIQEGSNLYHYRSSVYASFIESVSNLAEAGLSIGHPMVASDWDGLNGFYQGEQDGKLRAYAETWWTPRFEMSLSETLSNEAYVTSALAAFVKRDYIDDDKDTTVYTGTRRTIVRDLFKALKQESTPEYGIIGMLRQYDAMNSSEEAWRFLREFFLFDYRTERDIRTDFELVKLPVKEAVLLGRYRIRTTDRAPIEHLFSPYVDRERAALHVKAARLRSIKYPKDHLLQESIEALKSFDEIIASVEAEMPALRKSIVPFSEYLSRIVKRDAEAEKKRSEAQERSPDKLIEAPDYLTTDLAWKACIGLKAAAQDTMCDLVMFEFAIGTIGKGQQEKYLNELKDLRRQHAEMIEKLKLVDQAADPAEYQKFYEQLKSSQGPKDHRVYREFAYAVNLMRWMTANPPKAPSK